MFLAGLSAQCRSGMHRRLVVVIGAILLLVTTVLIVIVSAKPSTIVRQGRQ